VSAHRYGMVRRRFFRKSVDHGAREFRGHAVDAEGHELIGAEMGVPGIAHVLDELARDIMNREREELLLR